MSRFIDLKGRTFGKLKVLQFDSFHPRGEGSIWLCQCSCGSPPKLIRGQCLQRKLTTSCGCVSIEKSIERIKKISTTHGKSKTRLYTIWKNMKQRCSDKGCKSYPDYGGKGIRVCKSWNDSFEKFAEDMGEPPSKSHTLDRKDPKKGYSKSNCRWATRQEQSVNKTNNVLLTFQGKTQTMSQWATELGLNYASFRSRIRRNWPLEKIFKEIQ